MDWIAFMFIDSRHDVTYIHICSVVWLCYFLISFLTFHIIPTRSIPWTMKEMKWKGKIRNNRIWYEIDMTWLYIVWFSLLFLFWSDLICLSLLGLVWFDRSKHDVKQLLSYYWIDSFIHTTLHGITSCWMIWYASYNSMNCIWIWFWCALFYLIWFDLILHNLM